MSNGLTFIPQDTEAIKTALIAEYERITETTVLPGSPEYQYILWTANVIVMDRVGINYAGNQNIPRYASGEYLDALADLFHRITRKGATAASTTIRFNISAVQSSSVLIPKGTRVTTKDKSVTFATTADIYVAIGNTYADIAAECQTLGIIGNDYSIGQINQIVDLYDYYSSCSNTTVSDGGADEENDDELYERMKESEDTYSTAGPMGAYIYWAKSVSSEITDVKAVQPNETVSKTLAIHDSVYAFLGGDNLDTSTLKVYPHGSTTAATITTDYTVNYTDGLLTISIITGGALAGQTQLDVTIINVKAGYVYIYALMNDGTKASSTIKDLILAACNDETVRPMTDYVSVHDPAEVTYNITFDYYMPSDSTQSSTDIESKVSAAVETYKAWQSARLGRDINPSYLIGLLMQTGIKRVALTYPAFTSLSDGSDHSVPQLAIFGTATITNKGYEHE
jgi:phage-related baseplate assembly protein